MKLIKLLYSSLLAGLLLITASAQAQNNYELLPESTMQITGTSTIHDWECEVQEMNFNIDLADGLEAGTIPASTDFIQNLSLTVPVSKIESGKGGMNRKIYDALKEKKHPEITFQFTSGEIAERDTTAGTFTVKSTGDLTIAGVTKTVSFPVQGSITDEGNVNFTGSYSLNMKDYNVDPPSAVFGTIKAGEEVSIKFNILLGKEGVAQN